MTALSFTVTDAGRAEIINANNTGTGPVTITHIALGSGQYPPAKAQTSLQQEFKRLSVFGGEVVADDVIHVTITDDGPDQYTLGEFGLISDKGTLIALYAQTTPILEKNAEGIVLLSADMTLTSIDANSITFGPAEFVYPPASLTRAGVVVLSNAVNSTSQTQAATPQAVKTVNDALENHKAAGSAHTKAQVGLGSVENYPMASQAEAEAGSSLIRYMSPIRVKQAIDKFIGTATQAALNTKETPAGAQAKVDAHGNRTDNPHSVTKAQVGLGSVENYPLASQAEAEAGSSLIRYMSPIRVKQAIDKFIGTATQAALNTKETPAGAQAKVDAHGNRTDNPHNVTKAQVGLGNVENWSWSHSYADATGGATKYASGKAVADAYNALNSSKLNASSYTPADVLAKLKTVDGAASGLDADLFDGVQRTDMEAALKAYTDTKVAGLVDAAPGTLDTLNELAAALGDDPNFATTMTNQLAKKLNAASYTASDVLAKLKTVDGAASGLDTDLLDGQHGSYYLAWGNFTGVPATATRWPSFAEVTGKPGTYPPDSHAHTWASITGKPATFPPANHGHSWNEITGKPELFTPTGEYFPDGSHWAIVGKINTPDGVKPLIKQYVVGPMCGHENTAYPAINLPIAFPTKQISVSVTTVGNGSVYSDQIFQYVTSTPSSVTVFPQWFGTGSVGLCYPVIEMYGY